MPFEDIKYLFNDGSIIKIYNSNHDFVAYYDGKESIPDEFDEAYVFDIFADELYSAYAIGIELDIIITEDEYNDNYGQR